MGPEQESRIPPDKLPLPPAIDRERLIIHQTTQKGNGKAWGVSSKQIDYDRWVGVTTLDEYIAKFKGDEPEPTLPTEPLTIGEKVTRLWDAHPELHA